VARRVRPTLRCLREYLGQATPRAVTPLDEIGWRALSTRIGHAAVGRPRTVANENVQAVLTATLEAGAARRDTHWSTLWPGDLDEGQALTISTYLSAPTKSSGLRVYRRAE
jgi:hypothetical protein